MYYYQGGSIIFDSDIVSGDIRYDDRATPPGIFTLYYKKSPDVLRGAKKPDGTYEYETSVTYWMPFNGGIGFHDATWQAPTDVSTCRWMQQQPYTALLIPMCRLFAFTN